MTDLTASKHPKGAMTSHDFSFTPLDELTVVLRDASPAPVTLASIAMRWPSARELLATLYAEKKAALRVLDSGRPGVYWTGDKERLPALDTIEALRAKGQTFKQIAARLRVPYATLHGFYSGKNPPSAKTLRRLSQFAAR